MNYPQKHQLIRITLVNWYLFAQQDINISGSVILSGRNGAGKSSILDAIQTILAGANESIISMNAASSENGSSGRTIRDYVLGKIRADSNDVSAFKRDRANSYISLTFKDSNDQYYSFGCGFYAEAGIHTVAKHFFTIKGYSLNSTDFLVNDKTIMPFTDFSRRMKASSKEYIPHNSSIDFRRACCELMSRSFGRANEIDKERLFRAISQGLKFKPSRNVTEFVRNNVLNADPINVGYMKDMYRQYKMMEQKAREARELLDSYGKIIQFYETAHHQRQIQLIYEYIALDAHMLSITVLKNSYSAELIVAQDSLQEIISNKERLQIEEDSALQVRDLAYSAMQNSNVVFQVKEIQSELEALTGKENDFSHNMLIARQALALLSGLAPENIHSRLNKSDLVDKISRFYTQVNEAIGGFDLVSMGIWPETAEQLTATITAVDGGRRIREEIKLFKDDLSLQNRNLDIEIRELSQQLIKLNDGKASLMQETQIVIKLLADIGVLATPICELAEITDDRWQPAIEAYIGNSNREALVCLNDDGSAISESMFERALAAYRRHRREQPQIGKVKLLNPWKISNQGAMHYRGTAAEFIDSNNDIVRDYLVGLLQNVELVDTESELRNSIRGISKDGIVASNGTISGLKTLPYLLFGQAARRQSAKTLEIKLVDISNMARSITMQIDLLEKISFILNSSIHEVADDGNKLLMTFNKMRELTKQQERLKKTLVELQNNQEYDDLKRRFMESDTCWQQFRQNKELAIRQEQEKNSRIENLRLDLDNLAEKLLVIEEDIFNFTTATDIDYAQVKTLFDQLLQEHGEQYRIIQEAACEAKIEYEKKAVFSEAKGNEKLRDLCYQHDLVDKEKFLEMSMLEKLSECQSRAHHIERSSLVQYEHDAKHAHRRIIELFRTEVAVHLKACFDRMHLEIDGLNRTLKDIEFHNTIYRFIVIENDDGVLKEIYEYIKTSDSTNADGGLFDSEANHPGLVAIEQLIQDGRLDDISDYRNFYHFDISKKDLATGATDRFSKLLKSGSGGEQQSPFYVALGAAFTSAYRLDYSSGQPEGGACLAIFDEAMSKMDGDNTAGALTFFRNIGLQVILAAPSDAKVKVESHVDMAISIIRAGNRVLIDSVQLSDDGKTMLDVINPDKNSELAGSYLDAVKVKHPAYNEAD
jgi:Uncharacterized protein conserved in bacteria